MKQMLQVGCGRFLMLLLLLLLTAEANNERSSSEIQFMHVAACGLQPAACSLQLACSLQAVSCSISSRNSQTRHHEDWVQLGLFN